MLFCGTSFSANFINADYDYKYKGEKVSPKIATIVVFLTLFYGIYIWLYQASERWNSFEGARCGVVSVFPVT